MRYTHKGTGGGNFEPLPIAKYSAVPSKVEQRNGPKREYLAVTFNILEPGYENRKVFYNAPFNTYYLDQLLIALGYEVIEGEEIEFDTEDSNWTKPVILSIGHKVYEGKTQEVVLSISSASSVVIGGELTNNFLTTVRPGAHKNAPSLKNGKKIRNKVPF